MLSDILDYTRTLLKEVIPPGGTAVDATAGNGHDTLFLARCTGDSGSVYAFDIQEAAIEKTKKRLEEADLHAHVIQDGHENAASYIKEAAIDAAVFNLGYLPGSDKSVTTSSATTIKAVSGLLEKLKPGGRIVLVVYHGHQEGALEKAELLPFMETLPQDQFRVLRYQFINQRNSPPFIIAAEKRQVW
ncbi:tRNA (mnm(5)s(2)U34)-methyltransferase [Alkalicoccus halolimnae]|uniref:Class I SAM-dependent methyltransferase n=1 Tax=Alkalicoccus halolimnae TaxID=1667239 RepID=A0A5C7F398_9BACI|nr:class I SAM-dependent methyltransferase [Alkalicoccus halolimnae]TXF81966.1 methyltransferase domain-containing protein [Alkalicoccus halolimnae]